VEVFAFLNAHANHDNGGEDSRGQREKRRSPTPANRVLPSRTLVGILGCAVVVPLLTAALSTLTVLKPADSCLRTSAGQLLQCSDKAVPLDKQLRDQAISLPPGFRKAAVYKTFDGVTIPVQATQIVLKRSERRLFVYQGETELASYPVAVGRPGWETPLGTFQVRTMVKNPGWTHPETGVVLPPGSSNPLGERWIEFWTDGFYSIGFHGTPRQETVGQAVSHGCVRMYNEDIRELYEWVSEGTTVRVEP